MLGARKVIFLERFFACHNVMAVLSLQSKQLQKPIREFFYDVSVERVENVR